MIPTDVVLEYNSDIEAYGVDLDLLHKALKEARVKTSIIALDACRTLPLGKGQASSTVRIPASTPSGTFIFFATSGGMVALENKNGRNSYMTQSLIKYLPLPNLSLYQIYLKVRQEVKEATQERQIPTIAPNLENDLIFLFQETVDYEKDSLIALTALLSAKLQLIERQNDIGSDALELKQTKTTQAKLIINPKTEVDISESTTLGWNNLNTWSNSMFKSLGANDFNSRKNLDTYYQRTNSDGAINSSNNYNSGWGNAWNWNTITNNYWNNNLWSNTSSYVNSRTNTDYSKPNTHSKRRNKKTQQLRASSQESNYASISNLGWGSWNSNLNDPRIYSINSRYSENTWNNWGWNQSNTAYTNNTWNNWGWNQSNTAYTNNYDSFDRNNYSQNHTTSNTSKSRKWWQIFQLRRRRG